MYKGGGGTHLYRVSYTVHVYIGLCTCTYTYYTTEKKLLSFTEQRTVSLVHIELDVSNNRNTPAVVFPRFHSVHTEDKETATFIMSAHYANPQLSYFKGMGEEVNRWPRVLFCLSRSHDDGPTGFMIDLDNAKYI